jgi:transcriptional regulator with XRE-family HTH domain
MMATIMATANTRSVGDLLRTWRERRRLSQMALALDADVSARHLSFLETGRARPSREMILRLAERLAVPLRDRNTLLLAGGYAPAYPERSLEDPALRVARQAIERVLAGHEPYPAIAVDRHWTLVAANRAVSPLLSGVAAELLRPPANVLRLSLHRQGLAPRIANLRAWRGHLLARLHEQVERSADPVLEELLGELKGYPAPESAPDRGAGHQDHTLPNLTGIAIPLQLRTDAGLLTFISTTMVFGTPTDVTLSELAIEAFFPADAATAQALPPLLESTVPGEEVT